MPKNDLNHALDLRFKEVHRNSLRVLTAAQSDAYNERGYCHPFTAFTGEAVATTRAYIDHLLDLLKAEGQTDSYALLGYHTRCPGLYDVVTNDRILDVIEDIIGPNIICWTSHVFCKIPHDPVSVPFHQDATYWPLTPARTVSAWLAVDDSDRENSCLQIIPGTHRKGPLASSKAKDEQVLDRNIGKLDQKIDNLEAHGAPVDIELKAGQFSIHADLAAHGSAPNKSHRRRCGFAIRYCPPTVRPLTASWGNNAILCRGKDGTGHWTHNQRPEKDDVSSWQSYWFRKSRDGTLPDIKETQEGGNIGA
jgi:non-heme Fe2+,alpha-ketoglutarate-dependent halogenase